MSRAFRLLAAMVLAGACSLSGQSKKADDLGVGKILVSTRRAGDSLFAKSVILLVRYNEQGALGLMVNRRTAMPISQALRELNGAAPHAEPVFVGGPVELDTVFALTRAAEKPEGASAVSGGISFIVAKSALEQALGGSTKPGEFRVYLGYCGWGPKQLENEMRYDAWYIFSKSEDAAFDPQPDTLWSRLIDKAEAQAARLEVAPRLAGRISSGH
jgi:putative transcriptional regulator